MSLRLGLPAALLAVGLGCQAPFGTDRHDLVADRILGITVVVPSGDPSDGVAPLAWRVVDGRAWSDEAVGLAWSWLDPAAPDVDAIDPLGDVDAIGPHPLLQRPDPADTDVLGLVATFPSGHTSRAILELPPLGPAPLPAPTLTLSRADGPSWNDAEEEDLAAEARADWPEQAAASIARSDWARLDATWDEGPPEALTRVRWMATAGTFLELDATRTDWAPVHLVFDDLEIDEVGDRVDPGPVTVVALALDERAGTSVGVRELWVGEPDRGLSTHGRWLGTDDDVPDTPYVAATLTADEHAPTGLALRDLQGLTAADLSEVDPYGTESLPCDAAVSGPFDPDWLLDGRCLRPALLGQRVVVEVSR